ncbi:MAG: transketolase [Candidatus Curtissbacteria bacterium]|nr:transketolase [Candidatus Curtissbacteria bacterium]
MNDIEKLAKLVRFNILKMTTDAGSGHPTSSLSATDIMVALFFGKMRFDLENPQNSNNDRVIFSKGHASPLFYALWAVAGAISADELKTYRKFGSGLEGHPTSRFKYAEAATGSLGQGLSIGVGMAINGKYLDKLDYLTYVLMGDSETAEGSVWEAAEIASYYKLSNLVAIVDVNRLGQSGETMLGWDTDKYAKRFEAFSWEAHVIDGHDLDQIAAVFAKVDGKSEKPQVIIAKTIKGKGVSFLENKEGWHGKALSKEDFEKAVEELGEIDFKIRGKIAGPVSSVVGPAGKTGPVSSGSPSPQSVPETEILSSMGAPLAATRTRAPIYKIGEEVATRKAYGEAIAALGDINQDIVVLDGEVKNSTFAEIFKERHPERFFEMFIAEQNMAGAALGLSKRGKIPFASTFATFWTRAFDQIRMSAYSRGNIKFVGSHAGVSIGEDGPSQMGLEDIAMFRSVFGSIVLCPGDANACVRLVQEAANTEGIIYIRTNRPATPVIYKNSEEFKIGGSKVVRSTKSDKLTVVSCGVTLLEAIKAAEELHGEGINIRVIDAYSIKPIDADGIGKAVKETGNLLITVEDHYPQGGLGDAVLEIFATDDKVKIFKLAVLKMPMSGKGNELLDYEGISKSGIAKKVRQVLNP